MKKRISFILTLSMLLSFFNFNYSYGEVVQDGRVVLPYLLEHNYQPQGGMGYRLTPYESKMYPQTVVERRDKPKGLFSLSLNGGIQHGTTFIFSPLNNPNVGENTGFGEGKSDFTNAVIYAQKGDVVTMTNLSTPGDKPIKNIHVQQHSAMFPVHQNTRAASTTDIPLESNYKTLNAAGEYGYYLYAINTDELTSDNGNHWASGASNTGSTAWRNTFFKQYFTAVKVIVPNIQVQEVYIDVDNNFSELQPMTSTAKTWGESYTGAHKSFSGKVPDGVLIRYSWDSTDGYPQREPITNVNINLNDTNPNLTRDKVNNIFDSGKGLYFIVTYYYKNQSSSINVDFDAIHNFQNVNNSTVRVENFPVTLNLVDKSTSQGGTINNWNWTRLNTQTSGVENFSNIKNPSMTFADEDTLKKYLNANSQMLVSLEARESLNNIGTKTRYIQFEFMKSGARIEITGNADPVSIPYGQTWASGTVNFTARAMDLAPGEVIEEWHTEIKTPRNEALGFRERINHNSTNIQIPRTVTTDISQTNRRVWLKAELKTNRGTYVNEGYVDVPSSIQSQPPIAVIEGKTTISLGDPVTFDGAKSYSPDPNYFVEEYWWNMPSGTTILTKDPIYGYIDRTRSRIEAYFTSTGTKIIELDVWNNRGVVSRDAARHIITVTEPFPKAVITVAGYLKENREVFLDSVNSTGNAIYPIDPTKTYWTIAPAGGQSGASMRVDGALTQAKLRTLFKDIGDYRVRLYVTNTFGNSDMAEQIITITPDNPPVVNFTTTTTIHRDPNKNNKATIRVQDQSYSPDADHIAQRIWRYTFDSNNDGIFNETWYTVDSTNKEVIEFEVSHVGKYRIELEAIEGFSQPTIDHFVTASDRRRGNTDNKPLAEKSVEVDNIPPVALFEMTKKKQVDIVFNVSDIAYDDNELQSRINSILKPQLEAKNIDYNISLLNNRPHSALRFYFFAEIPTSSNGSPAGLFYYEPFSKKIERIKDYSNDYYYNRGIAEMWLASSGKLYFIEKTRPSRICMYDPVTQDFSVAHEGASAIYSQISTGLWSNGYHVNNISADDSIYFFEYTDYNKTLKRLNTKTNIVTTYGTTPKNGQTFVSGADKYGNVAVIEGTYTEYGGVSNGNDKRRHIKVYRPNGVIIPLGSYNNIGSAAMSENGTLVFHAENRTNTNYYNEQFEHFFMKATLNNAGTVTSYNTLPLGGFSTRNTSLKFKPNNENVVIINFANYMYLEYDLQSQSITSEITTNNTGYIGDALNARYFLRGYTTTVPKYAEYDINQKTFVDSGITIDKLREYLPDQNVWVSGNRDDDSDGYWRIYYATMEKGQKVNPLASANINIPDSLDVVLGKLVWREHADRIIINLNNNEISEITNKKQLADVIAKAITNQVHVVGFGSNINRTQYQTLLNNIGGKGFHTSNVLNTPMQELTDYIVAALGNKVVDTYLLLNEEVEVKTTYEDRENDPKLSQRWRYTHNHLYFTNSLGQISDSGTYRVTPYYLFDRVGLYQTIFQVQDNPTPDTRFANYRKWSDTSLTSNNIYVHRRPIAEFNYSLSFAGGLNWNIALNSQSYDLDHMDKASLGIAEERWRFKEIDQANWTNSKPTTLLENKIYLAELTVKDLEGVWSYPVVKQINTDPNQMPPTIRANPEKLNNWYNRANFLANGDLRVNVIAQAYGSKTITDVKYSWSQSITTPGAWTTTAQSNFNLTQATDGRWYLHAQATDSTGLTASAVFGQYPIDKTPPTQPTIINNQNWTNSSQVHVNIIHGTDAMSGLDKSLYRLTGATPQTDTTYYGQFSITNEGTTNIIARTLDVAGNSSGEINSIVRIDRTPPTIDANPQTYRGMSPLSVTITASDTGGSGFKDMRYSWTLSDAKPTAGWITRSSPATVTTQGAEGTWYLHMEAFDNAGNSFYRYRSYIIEDLKVLATLVPNPAMAGDQLIFTITTEGNAERLEIFVDPDIMTRDQRVQMGYPAQDYPIRVNVDSTKNIKTDIVKYVLWVTTYETLDKNNIRLRPTYKFTVRAWKGTLYKDVELELEVKRNVLELLKPGIKDKNDK